MTASPYLSRSRISRWKFQRDWPTGRNTGNNYYLPGVSYVFIVPGTRTVWLAFYAASTVPALHLTILLSRRANSRESPTNWCFQIPKALRCMFTAPVGLFPAEELFLRYTLYFSTIFQVIAITIITSNYAAVNCFDRQNSKINIRFN